MSREPGFADNSHGYVLKRVKDNVVTIVAGHASDCAHHFVQTSTEGLKTIEAKHKFELFAASCGLKIKHYHADNKIFN